jgi:RNA recognition motif-containing protein
MGELEPWIDENFVRNLWFQMGEQVSVKMIRDKFSGYARRIPTTVGANHSHSSNAGYCFVDFSSPQAAAKALQLNGQPMPNSQRQFKLNWASGGGLADRRYVTILDPDLQSGDWRLCSDDRSPEFSIFVGDLGPEVNEYVLVNIFQARFPSCKSAKIMTDPLSGMSRGYGFVRFSDEADQQRALSEMQGVYCGNRPMRISTATPKNKGGPGGMNHMMGGGGNAGAHMGGYPPPMGGPPMTPYYGGPQPMNQFTDPNNTTVFVGGLSGYVTEDELRSFFQGFGEITYVKIPPGKGCGFVQFVQRHAAEMAINQMQGYPIGNSRVRLSWGRSQNNSGPAGTPYRPAPPPPIYPNMGMPPTHQYNNYAPMKVSLASNGDRRLLTNHSDDSLGVCLWSRAQKRAFFVVRGRTLTHCGSEFSVIVGSLGRPKVGNAFVPFTLLSFMMALVGGNFSNLL